MNSEKPISFSYWTPWMQRAINLASISDGCTSPNPLVGAVILDSNQNLIGEGFHAYAGGAHAEIEALNQSGEQAKGGTLIVTLEPCCHFGKTPPCTDAILKSGIKRVVVGLLDPDPRVSGKGISLLKEAGIEVITGILQEEIKWQNRAFLFRVKNGRPWGILKWAMSLDGRTALPNGKSKWISQPGSREFVHRLRAKCDAVIVGGGTVRADNPLLTTRGIAKPEPKRVVLTNSLNLPKNSKLMDTSIAETLVAHGPQPNCLPKDFQAFKKGPEFLELSSTEPRNLVIELAKKGCNRVLWECGANLATEAIRQDCVQEIYVFLAPKLLGGIPSMTPSADFGFDSMSQVIQLNNLHFQRRGNDFLFNMLFN